MAGGWVARCLPSMYVLGSVPDIIKAEMAETKYETYKKQ